MDLVVDHVDVLLVFILMRLDSVGGQLGGKGDLLLLLLLLPQTPPPPPTTTINPTHLKNKKPTDFL